MMTAYETYEVPGGTKWYWAVVKSEDGKKYRAWARDLYDTEEDALTAAEEYDKQHGHQIAP